MRLVTVSAPDDPDPNGVAEPVDDLSACERHRPLVVVEISVERRDRDKSLNRIRQFDEKSERVYRRYYALKLLADLVRHIENFVEIFDFPFGIERPELIFARFRGCLLGKITKFCRIYVPTKHGADDSVHGKVRIAAYRRREVTVKLASEPEVRRGRPRNISLSSAISAK